MQAGACRDLGPRKAGVRWWMQYTGKLNRRSDLCKWAGETISHLFKGAAMDTNTDNSDVNAVKVKPFSAMTPKEKVVHIGKVFLCIITFGFMFPNVGAD
ncbi:MAG: hypothetical protein AMJ67_00580 [Betaproteobacteria bacterium SG8_41]|jgi:hypothetical protein|nr:MAG: hypothetical protein AMJ67_00580 [Betaproteobacteria bacterium SG8_41]